MRRSWMAAGLASVAMLSLALGTTFGTVEAKPEPKNEKPKVPDNPAWSEPIVSGHIIDTFWAESKNPNEQTAVIVVWSNDADLAVRVYADAPVVREAVLNGTACVGRYITVGGDRIDEDEMSALGIDFIDTNAACERTLL